MTEIALDRTRVDSFLRELVPLRVAKHVRMNGEREAGDLARASDDLVDAPRRQRSSSFAREDES